MSEPSSGMQRLTLTFNTVVQTMVQLGAAWHVPCDVLTSKVAGASLDCFGDDIAHGMLE
jgi:hypothetical protein